MFFGSMKFAHMADCHIGGWREPTLKQLTIDAFAAAVDICIAESVDFVLIAGDFFNTSLPPIVSVKDAVTHLKRLKDQGIPVYYIAGSHDFSPSGSTMLDVLEEADLMTNVCRGEIADAKLKLHFTQDQKTGAKITGIIGKKGMLDRKYYEQLHREHLEDEEGFKIFMFHTALTELKPKHLEKMESSPTSFLPKKFSYYAGGHVHIVEHTALAGYDNLVYPGPTFPNSFSELEKLGCGGFYIYDDGEVTRRELNLKAVKAFTIDCENKTPEQIMVETQYSIQHADLADAIVLLRLEGTLSSGGVSDIDFKSLFASVYEGGALFVMKNTAKLDAKGFEEIKVAASPDEIEDTLLQEYQGTGDPDLLKRMMHVLMKEKHEGEKVADFEKRLISELDNALSNV